MRYDKKVETPTLEGALPPTLDAMSLEEIRESIDTIEPGNPQILKIILRKLIDRILEDQK